MFYEKTVVCRSQGATGDVRCDACRQVRYDEAKYYCLARCRGEGVPNIGYAAQMMVCQSTCVAHMPVHVHCIIQHYADVTNIRLRTKSFSIDVYNNWPQVTSGRGRDSYDFSLAAVES